MPGFFDENYLNYSVSPTDVAAGSADELPSFEKNSLQSGDRQITHFVGTCIEEHRMSLERIVNYYKNTPSQRIYGATYLYAENSYSTFEQTPTCYQKCWVELKSQLEDIYSEFTLAKYPEHSLALLLEPNNAHFLNSVEWGNLSLHEEVGLIAIQRLKDIANSENKTEKIAARKLLHQYIGQNAFVHDGLFYYNEEALKAEILNLAMQANLHPEKKLIWLGSARSVDAMIRSHPEEATYLSCDEKQYSWELNRAWLQTAAKLGYEFQLVEQQFPDIENAILSGNTTQLIIQLAREIRGKKITSQHSRGDSPTAGYQETLLLMEMGYRGVKSADGSLRLLPPEKCVFEFAYKKPGKGHTNPLRHSCPDVSGEKSYPYPLNPEKCFTAPPSSPIIRGDHSSPVPFR